MDRLRIIFVASVAKCAKRPFAARRNKFLCEQYLIVANDGWPRSTEKAAQSHAPSRFHAVNASPALLRPPL